MNGWNRNRLLRGVCALFLATAVLFPGTALGLPSETEKPSAAATATAAPSNTPSAQSDRTASAGEKREDAPKATEKPQVDSQGRPILGEGETGILVERKSGTVLFESEAGKRMYPASTTKIMTALLAVEALENGELALEETVEITAEMLDGLDPDSSNMALKEGEIISVEHLLEGLMIPSGNDAAMALAYRISGSPEAFVEKMNARAESLGLQGTHFMNPHGLHHENHYTTAADLAELARTAMGYDAFRNLVDIVHVKIPPTNKTEKQRYYINTNGLLSAMRYRDYVYKGATGIKTGRTTEAGNCLVSSAQRDGMELIGVILGGKEIKDSHKDSIRILDYGFENYGTMQAVSKGEILGEVRVKQGKTKDSVTLSAVSGVTVVVPKGTGKEELEIRMNAPDALYAPLTKGQEAATVSVLHQGKELGIGKLCVDVDVARSAFWPVLALGEWLWSMTFVRILTYVLLAALVVFIFIMIVGLWKELKRAKAQKRRRSRRGGRK